MSTQMHLRRAKVEDADATTRAQGDRVADPPGREPTGSGRSRLLRVAPVFALLWSVGYLVLGATWLAGADGYPWQEPGSSVDVSLMDLPSERLGAWLVVGAATLGLVLCTSLIVLGRRPRPGRALRVGAVLSIVLGILLAVVVPDFRLLAGLGYTPILLAGWVQGFARDISPGEAYDWPWINLLLLSLAGLGFVTGGVRAWMTASGACRRCGRSQGGAQDERSAARTAWWGRVAVGVAVAVPVGYAVTRFAWALGIPLGVTAKSFEDIRTVAGFGAGLGAFAILGAILTIGLVRHWGEVFPRWVPGLHGRRVPVGLAVVPAGVVSVAVTSAGLMFVRLAITGFGDAFPVGNADVAGWLPELFWPLWGVALATATYAYWLRRRGACTACSAAALVAAPQPGRASR